MEQIKTYDSIVEVTSSGWAARLLKLGYIEDAGRILSPSSVSVGNPTRSDV